MIDDDILNHTAALARLDLSLLPQDEVASLRDDLGRILEYMQSLDELDVEGVEPMTHAMSAKTLKARPDEPQSPPGAETILSGAPAREGAFFVVPRVVDAGEGDDE